MGRRCRQTRRGKRLARAPLLTASTWLVPEGPVAQGADGGKRRDGKRRGSAIRRGARSHAGRRRALETPMTRVIAGCATRPPRRTTRWCVGRQRRLPSCPVHEAPWFIATAVRDASWLSCSCSSSGRFPFDATHEKHRHQTGESKSICPRFLVEQTANSPRLDATLSPHPRMSANTGAFIWNPWKSGSNRKDTRQRPTRKRVVDDFVAVAPRQRARRSVTTPMPTSTA